MKSTKLHYLLFIFAITLLIYDQSAGFNAVLISLISIIYLGYNSTQTKSTQWWLGASLWFISGISLFINHTYLGGVLYFFTGLHFMSINSSIKQSFPVSVFHAFISSAVGLTEYFKFNRSNKKETDVQHNKKLLKSIIMYSVTILIVILFLKLYQLANPDFEKYTAFLNLKFLKFEFIILYFILSITLYGLFNFQSQPFINKFDEQTKNTIDKSYTDSVQKNLGIDSEQKMSILLITVLNILLIAFLLIDGHTLFFKVDGGLTHSEYVHQGINTLVTSIVFVILIVSCVFRGGINFTANKNLKILTYLWLSLNLILTIFNAIKNYEYIHEWGMTHKRIGVYTYLILCIIGLAFTIYKVAYKKSMWFLIRRVSFTFVSVLVLYCTINWNTQIVKYNLNPNRFTSAKIDFYYNANLGPETYPIILEYITKYGSISEDFKVELNNKITSFMVKYQSDWTAFPSIKIGDLIAYEALKGYEPISDRSYYQNGDNPYYD